jgi:hypothetical protein
MNVSDLIEQLRNAEDLDNSVLLMDESGNTFTIVSIDDDGPFTIIEFEDA